MLFSLLRMLVGLVAFQIVRQLFRGVMTRREAGERPSPPPPKATRITIDRKNIVDGKFDEV